MIDGLFLHYLIKELNENLQNGTINKIDQPTKYELIFTIRNNHVNHKLYFNFSKDAPRIHITHQLYSNPATPYNFCVLLRKYLMRGIIKNITQINNDRIFYLTINSYDEMGFDKTFYLYFELTGRSNNLILVDNDYLIIDSTKKVLPNENQNRLIIPKSKYIVPLSGKVNPFTVQSCLKYDLEGIAKSVLDEMDEAHIQEFINQEIKPCCDNKTYYLFKLHSMDEAHIKYFESLSELLDIYYIKNNDTNVNEANLFLEKIIKREINKRIKKLENFNDDLKEANINLSKKKDAILLQYNLYQVNPGDKELVVNDYETNQEVKISLDPQISPTKNLENLFKLTKKAQTTVEIVNEQIIKCNEEINYLEALYYQIKFLNQVELEQVKLELEEKHFIRLPKKNKKNLKIQIPYYIYSGITIIFGKNNYQNNLVTNKIGKTNPNWYWFHIKDAPGSHVVCQSEELNEDLIRFCSNLAAYYSKYSNSSTVAVDYTQIRYIKKINGLSGNNVTYTNQKTMYIDPDNTKFEKLTLYYKNK